MKMNRIIKLSSISLVMLLLSVTASAQIIKRTEAPKKVEERRDSKEIFGERNDDKKIVKKNKSNRKYDKHPNWKKGHKKQVKKKHPVFIKHPGRAKQAKRKK